MIITTSDGVNLFIEKEGSGFPCIYLHGGPGYWSKSFQHFVGKSLEEDLEMIYLDQRGCGRSSLAANRDYSLERLLEDLEEVRVQLKIKEWYVMGHSFGALLAVNYANSHPKSVKGLMLSNGTLDMKESFTHQVLQGRKLLGMDELEPPGNNVPELVDSFFFTALQLMEKNLFYQLQFTSLADKEKMDAIDEELESQPDFQQYIFSNEEYFQDFRSLTSSITKPVLVLSGKYDDAIGPDHQEAFHFENATYIQLDSGHHPYVDCSNEFQKAVLDFIRG